MHNPKELAPYHPKELAPYQIRILENICKDGTLEILATIEAGFASWGNANFLAKEVVRLALMVEALEENAKSI